MYATAVASALEESKADKTESGMPSLLNKCCDFYKTHEKNQKLFDNDKKHDDPHKVEKMKGDTHEKYVKHRSRYINTKIPQICTNWCNFGQKVDTIEAYKALCSAHFGKLTPLKIRVDCYLTHGCDLLVGDHIGQGHCNW